MVAHPGMYMCCTHTTYNVSSCRILCCKNNCVHVTVSSSIHLHICFSAAVCFPTTNIINIILKFMVHLTFLKNSHSGHGGCCEDSFPSTTDYILISNTGLKLHIQCSSLGAFFSWISIIFCSSLREYLENISGNQWKWQACTLITHLWQNHGNCWFNEQSRKEIDLIWKTSIMHTWKCHSHVLHTTICSLCTHICIYRHIHVICNPSQTQQS